MIALAASLRNKAKSVLSSFKDTETLKTLLEKLEARFGEHLGSCSYSVLEEAHDSPSGGHFGVNKTLQKIPKDFIGLLVKKMLKIGVDLVQFVSII